MATPFETLLTGDLLGAVLQVYTDAMQFWFYLLGFSALMIMVYYRSKSPGLTGIIGLLVGSAMAGSGMFPPEGIGAIYLIIVLSIAGVLYSVFGPKGE